MKKVLLIIVLCALFPAWCMSESLKIDVYRAKNLENKLNYRDSERAFKCLANGINLTTTSRFLNVMTEWYGDSITHSFYNDKLIKKSVHIDRIVLTDYDDYLTVRQAMNGKTSY